jgi:hypothetical protein
MFFQEIISGILFGVIIIVMAGLLIWAILVFAKALCSDLIRRRIAINKSRAEWEKKK